VVLLALCSISYSIILVVLLIAGELVEWRSWRNIHL